MERLYKGMMLAHVRDRIGLEVPDLALSIDHEFGLGEVSRTQVLMEISCKLAQLFAFVASETSADYCMFIGLPCFMRKDPTPRSQAGLESLFSPDLLSNARTW
jgi:hypothetical protein